MIYFLAIWILLAWLGSRFTDRVDRLIALVAAREGLLLERRWSPPVWLRWAAAAFTPVLGMPLQGCVLIFVGVLCAAYLVDERGPMRFLAAQGARGMLLGRGISREELETMSVALDAWSGLGWTDEP